MNSPFRHLRTILFCLLALFALTAVSAAQSCTPTGNNVVTWHNDNNRTGWQQNMDNNPKTQGTTQDCAGNLFPKNPGALHAFCAAAITGQGTPCPSAMTELYSSRTVQTQIGAVNGFPTPTIFKGQVYMGTNTEVDVFGICSTNVGNGGLCLK